MNKVFLVHVDKMFSIHADWILKFVGNYLFAG
jgi:hypothetical protein